MKLGTIVWLQAGLAEATPGAHYPNVRTEALGREIAWARDFGFTGLQIGWRGKAPMEPARIAEVFRQEKVKIVALSAYTDFLNAQHNWPCRDMAAVKEMIPAAASMGVDTIVTWGGFGDPANEENRKRVRRDIEEVVRLAEPHGIKVALELYDQCVFGTVETICELAEELDTPALGIMMDPPNTMKESDLADLPGYYRRLMKGAGERLFAVHAKDVLFEKGVRKLPGPGQGQQNYVAFLQSLSEVGFDGHLMIEHVNRETVGPARNYVASKLREAFRA